MDIPARSPGTFLALGDSYTVGESVTAMESFPFQTVRLLRRLGWSMEDPEIIAETGWTTGDLLQAIRVRNFIRTYDVITLLIGVNNQYRGQSRLEYAKDFRQLLAEAGRRASFPRRSIFVLSIPDYSDTPFANNFDRARIASDILAFNRLNRSIAGEQSVSYIDITDESRKAGLDGALVAPDGLHYSASMYARWASLLAGNIRLSFP